MASRTKLQLTALMTTLTLAVAVSAAAANQLSVNETNFELTWTEARATTKLTFTAAGAEIACDVTLAGSFHSTTIAKVADSLIGAITSAALEECEGGGATILPADLPWHVTYGGIAGELPDIDRATLNLVGARFSVDPEGALPRCLAGTTAEHPGVGIAELGASGEATTITADEEAAIPLGGGFFCSLGGESHFSGTADVNGGDLVVILGEEPPRAVLLTLEYMTVTRLENNDTFLVRNIGTATATITSVDIEATDREEPEFEATAPGCGRTIAPGASCAYTIVVDRRPEREGEVTIHYRDGAEGEGYTSIDVAIEES